MDKKSVRGVIFFLYLRDIKPCIVSWQEKDIRDLVDLIDNGHHFVLEGFYKGEPIVSLDNKDLNIDYRVKQFIIDNTRHNNGELSDISFKKLVYCCKIKSLRIVHHNIICSDWKDTLCLGISENTIARTDNSNFLKNVSFEEKQSWIEEMKKYAKLPKPKNTRTLEPIDIDDARRESWWILTEGDEDLSWDL